MTHAPTLKPCPFCGADPCPDVQFVNYTPKTNTNWNAVWCEGCKANGPERTDKIEAITAWNTRTDQIEAGVVQGLPQEHWTVEALIVSINALTKAGNDLAFKAEISGGVAGRDEPLCDAIAHWAAERDKYRQVIRIVKFEGHDPEIGAGVLAMDPSALSRLAEASNA